VWRDVLWRFWISGQEYFINSESLQNKVRQLLPSQGGAGQGVDLSATTQIVPVIDLTETAEGSDVRPDLQTALSFSSVTSASANNATTDVITNTGYFRIFGNITSTSTGTGRLQATDEATTKSFLVVDGFSGVGARVPFDFIVFNDAGQTIQASSNATTINIDLVTRQVATIDGTLVDP